jgi:hypothetical protein
MYLEDTTFRQSSSMDPVVPYGCINDHLVRISYCRVVDAIFGLTFRFYLFTV